MIWTVIGGGPSGIGAVGKLLDHHQEVIWIDPCFELIGRMGQYYRGVPANTPNGSIWNAVYLCQSFHIESYIIQKKLKNELTLGDLSSTECSDLNYLVDVLEYITVLLQSHPSVTVIQGKVTLIILTNQWDIKVSVFDHNIQHVSSDFVIMATGATPNLPSNVPPNSPNHSVDMMVNTNTVKYFFEQHPEMLRLPWAVVGSSHSAMLVIKNFIEVGVQSIVNYYRSDFIFEDLTEEGWYRFEIDFKRLSFL